MKKFMTVLSVLAIATLVALPARAEKKDKPKNQEMTGTVSAIDAAKGTVVVENKKGAKTFTCNADTKVDLGRKELGKLADIKQGDKLKVKYVMKGETAVAEKLSMVNAEGPGKKGTPSAPTAPAAPAAPVAPAK